MQVDRGGVLDGVNLVVNRLRDLGVAVAARYRDDERGVGASGLLALEQRLARFLISERYQAHVRKVLGDLEARVMRAKVGML